MKQQARAGDIVLLFADESEALTHPYLAGPGQNGERFARRGSRPVAKDRPDRRARLRLPSAHGRDLANQTQR